MATSQREWRRQVWERELAFAATMAKRDLQGFRSFLSEEAVFMSEGTTLRGQDAVVSTWASYFETTEAPFSWQPDRVEVLDSGGLALSTGPVFDGSGEQVTRFSTIWRLEHGEWRVVFDKGDGD